MRTWGNSWLVSRCTTRNFEILKGDGSDKHELPFSRLLVDHAAADRYLRHPRGALLDYGFQHFQEEAQAGRQADGSWLVHGGCLLRVDRIMVEKIQPCNSVGVNL